ncbi:MAG: Nicotinate dehydrogenase small FeS subunit [Syntrophorhabdus sp. PtaB.Bin006]|nr:MAG: Nicotinate dehydrogenase small FeS subunit [Syntrophorhabdus sp. PtaB.Bin006]
MKSIQIKVTVNGEPMSLDVRPYETLLETLRERLHLTGAKEACSLGACGSCTVILDKIPVRACLVLTAEIDGMTVTTIEGLAANGRLHPLQEAFMEKGAVQCGFCTSGMILTAKSLLDREKKPSKDQIVRTISSNVCRCTGYKKIIEAVMTAAERMERT